MKQIFTSLLTILITTIVFGQSPLLVKDINPVTADVNSSSSPGKGIAINGKIYFAATDYQGREPWRTDGTGSGTIFLKDIISNAGALSSNPHDFVNVGNTVYFFIGDSASSQLWKIISTDTVKLVEDSIIYPHDVVVTGKTIVFSGRLAAGTEGQELLRFDTSVGFIQSFDINTGTGSSDPRNLVVKGDSVFFSADDGVNGREIWIYDLLNVSPVTMISDINTGPGSSDPYDLVVYHDTVFFSAFTDPDGVELYYSDGNVSGAGTGFLASINDINDPANSSNPSHKTVFNNKLFFSADNGVDGIELWQYDGNTSTTSMLADINSGPGNSDAGKYGFKAAGSFLYFAATEGTNGVELWKTDGTTTSLVSNIAAAGASSNPQDMYNINDTLIFVANDGNGPELWRSNGTNTALIQNIQPAGYSTAPSIVGKFNNQIYFGANNGSIGSELYVTNGLSAGTSLLKDIHHSGAGTTSNIPWFENFNSALYFPATKDNYNEQRGLHKTDATTAGTTEILAPNVTTGFYVGAPQGKALGSLLYFQGHTNAENNEIWKSDGTAVGTVLLKDIRTGTASSDPSNFTALGTKMLFTADDGTNGNELWISDGTTVGTTLLKDVRTGSNGSAIQNITVAGTKAFFTADDGTNGRELWVTDGTTGGTVLVKNIMAGAATSNPGGLTAVGSSLYFYANDGTNDSEPWKSDGTGAGTVMLSNINASGSSTANFGNFCTLGAFTYFGADDGTGTKLWRTDGTTTSLFNSIALPFQLVNVGSKIVFFCLPTGAQYGYEIYSTNGTTVTKVKDFAPYGLNNVVVDNAVVYQSNAFFYLDDNVHGQELWGTDGSTATLYEVAPGPSSSYPRHAKVKGTNPLLFTANDGTTKGDELWKLEFIPLPVSGLEFNVHKKDATKALLNWKTYTEFNNKGFEIQRSNDGRNFVSIGFVNSRGIVSNGANYEFIDPSPVTGKNYYRLKQTDLDGQFTYSQVRWVDFVKDIYVKAYPNPTTDVLNITSGYNFKSGQLVIRNAAGQSVKKQAINGSGTISIPVKDLPAGIYNIEIVEAEINLKLMFVKQ